MSKKKIQGRVLSNKCDKTITVLVRRQFLHMRYKKNIIRSKKYLVHDPYNICKVGDLVTCIESRPISKKKNWVIENNNFMSKL